MTEINELQCCSSKRFRSHVYTSIKAAFCFGLKMGFLSAQKYYLIFIELSGKTHCLYILLKRP